MNPLIRLCQHEDILSFSAHCIRHFREKSLDGGYSHPFPLNHSWDIKEYAEAVQYRWSRQPFSPQWEMAWVALVQQKIVAHLVLRSGAVEAETHRMKLGMGVENQYRSQGLGRKLLQTALLWAQSRPELAWIDLSVFATNDAARALYEKFDFQQTGLVVDAVRIQGQKIDEVQMTLRLHS